MHKFRPLVQLLLCFFAIINLHKAHAVNGEGSADEIPSIRQTQLLIEQQKVLSQQAAKAFVGLALNRKIPEFFIELDSARQQFEANLRKIETFVPLTPLQASVQKIRLAWDKFNVQSKKEIDKAEAEILLAINDELFNACELFSDELSNYKNSLLPEIASGVKQLDKLMMETYDQSIMAQEYLLYYFADKLGISKYSKRATTLAKDFSTHLKKLADANVNSASIDEGLHFIETQWKEVIEHLTKWNPENREYMSNLAIYGNWASERAVQVALQYFELAEVMSVSHLLNLASRHRTHTQELTKYHVAIAFQLGNINLIKKDLQNSVAVFETRIDRLLIFAPNEEIQTSVQTVALYWKNFKHTLTTNFEPTNVFKLIEQGHILMAACDKVTEQIEAYAESLPTYNRFQGAVEVNNRAARLINISGRSCMDLQRIPIYFALLSKDMGGSITDSRFKETVEQFGSTLEILQEASLNTPKMEAELEKIAAMWEAMNTEILSTVNNQDNERLAKAMDRANQIYVEMLKINSQYAIEMNLLIERKIRG